MANVTELFDVKDLHKTLDAGLVRAVRHPTEPLTIYNYTKQAQYDREWNAVTLNCRGLILDDAGEIVARPFAKFFNYGELQPGEIPTGLELHDVGGVKLKEHVFVTEKVDGSLGILYPTSEGYAVATRGSFTSPQALHATKVFRDRYAALFDQFNTEDYTFLVEIIYPENRIVLDYGDFDDLVLLDVLVNANGRSVFGWADLMWPGPIVDRYQYVDWRDVLKVDRVDHEGFVVHFFHANMRVKVKHDEYVRLHRILTNVSNKTVWEHLAKGLPFDELVENVPDEFFDWLTGTIAMLNAAVFTRKNIAHEEFKKVCAEASLAWSVWENVPMVFGPLPPAARKRFAEVAQTREPWIRGLLFRLLDRKPLDEQLWKLVRPDYARPFVTAGEDVA